MKKLVLSLVFIFSAILVSNAHIPQYCDDCWEGPVFTSSGWITINWTYTGGGSDCYDSYYSGNMYPWSTAYVYQNGVLVDIITFNHSGYVTCTNIV